MATMKAVRIHEYGGPESLVYEDAPKPEPGPGEVLIKVHAAGVNPLDWKVRQGYLKGHAPYHLPLTLGLDVSGVVESVGEGVKAFRAGDEVYGMLDLSRDGAYAEYVVAAEGLLAKKPGRLDHARAAAVPLAALTAYHALNETLGLKAGQKILIVGASGGVGSFAVQLAKLKGARVVGTASGKNQSLLTELGVDEAIDYTAVRFEEAVRDADFVLDTVGGENSERALHALRKGGTLAVIASQPPAEKAAALGVSAKYVQNRPDAAALRELAGYLDAGSLRTVVEALPLAQARMAHEKSQSGRVRGKLVLVPG